MTVRALFSMGVNVLGGIYIIVIAQCSSMVLSGMDLYWNQSSRLQQE